MYSSDIVQLITAVCALLAAIGTMWNNRRIKDTHATIATLEKNTNSIKDALVAATRLQAFQAGQIDQASQTDPSVIKPERALTPPND